MNLGAKNRVSKCKKIEIQINLKRNNIIRIESIEQIKNRNYGLGLVAPVHEEE